MVFSLFEHEINIYHSRTLYKRYFLTEATIVMCCKQESVMLDQLSRSLLQVLLYLQQWRPIVSETGPEGPTFRSPIFNRNPKRINNKS
jgi:hypothetical protein